MSSCFIRSRPAKAPRKDSGCKLTGSSCRYSRFVFPLSSFISPRIPRDPFRVSRFSASVHCPDLLSRSIVPIYCPDLLSRFTVSVYWRDLLRFQCRKTNAKNIHPSHVKSSIDSLLADKSLSSMHLRLTGRRAPAWYWTKDEIRRKAPLTFGAKELMLRRTSPANRGRGYSEAGWQSGRLRRIQNPEAAKGSFQANSVGPWVRIPPPPHSRDSTPNGRSIARNRLGVKSFDRWRCA